MAPPLKRILSYRGTFDIKNVFVKVLREIFASDIMEEEFRYVPSPDIIDENKGDDEGGAKDTKIRIYKSFPKRIQSYPCIIVATRGYDASLMALGEEGEEAADGFKDGILVGRSFVGHYIVPLEITVYAKDSTDDRDKLTDLLVVMLRILRRSLFHGFGVGYRTITVGGENQQEDPRDRFQIFTNSITVECQTDYILDLTIEESELVEKILLDVKGQAGPGQPIESLAPTP